MEVKTNRTDDYATKDSNEDDLMKFVQIWDLTVHQNHIS